MGATVSPDGSSRAALGPPYDAREIFAAARSGDVVARTIVDEVARRIAAHIAPVAAVADPALVVLGGGIGSNGDLLLAPVRRRVVGRAGGFVNREWPTLII